MEYKACSGIYTARSTRLISLVSTAHAEVQRRRQFLTADSGKERDRGEGDREEEQRREYQEDGLAVAETSSAHVHTL